MHRLRRSLQFRMLSAFLAGTFLNLISAETISFFFMSRADAAGLDDLLKEDEDDLFSKPAAPVKKAKPAKEEKQEEPKEEPKAEEEEEEDEGEDEETGAAAATKAPAVKVKAAWELPPLDATPFKQNRDGQTEIVHAVISADDGSRAAAAQVWLTARAWLRHDSDFKFLSINYALGDRSELESGEDSVEDVLGNIDDGVEAFQSGNFKEAAKTLEKGVKELRPFMEFPDYRESALAGLLHLAAAKIEAGDAKGGEQAMQQLLFFDPEATLPSKIGPKVREVYRTVKTGAAAADGKISVESKPVGMMVFVDGRYVGIAPVTASGISEGEHFVKVAAPGFIEYRTTTTLYKGMTKNIPVDMDQSAKFYQYTSEIEAMKRDFNHQAMFENVRNEGKVLGKDDMLFLRVSMNDSQMTLQGYYYVLTAAGAMAKDAKGKDVPDWGKHKFLERTIELRNEGLSLATIKYLQDLFADGNDWRPNYAPVQEAVAAGGAVWQQWWFWTILGTAVAAGATVGGVCGAGLCSSSKSGPSTPPGTTFDNPNSVNIKF